MEHSKNSLKLPSQDIIINMRNKIELNPKSISHINSIWRIAARKRSRNFIFNFLSTKLFNPALLAPFGVLLETISNYNNSITFLASDNKIIQFSPSRTRVNIFLSEYDYIYTKTNDIREQKFFEEYVNTFLFRHLKDISNYELNEFKQCIFELHENIKTHTSAKFFAISSYYEQDANTLTFTISNLGRSIPKKLTDYGFNFDSDERALSFALQKGHSTKLTSSGGLGLYVTNNFINKISGELHIVSGQTYMLSSHGYEAFTTLANFYPGTSITLVVPLNNLKRTYTLDLIASTVNLWEMI